jgi:OOP family OmpA-OmpF porin
MRTQQLIITGLLVALTATGCGIRQREWGTCAIAGGVIGAAVGGITGGALSNNLDDDTNDSARGGAIAGGIVGGGVLGALLGHVVCDPMKEAKVVAAPPPPPASIPAGTEIAELQGAHFAFDSDRLTPEGEVHLGTAVTTMNEHPDMKVVCEGNTDSIGSEAYNMQLGQRRADSARDYLISQGIDASRVRSVSFGESQPQASNDTAEGRAENRRVEVVVE